MKFTKFLTTLALGFFALQTNATNFKALTNQQVIKLLKQNNYQNIKIFSNEQNAGVIGFQNEQKYKLMLFNSNTGISLVVPVASCDFSMDKLNQFNYSVVALKVGINAFGKDNQVYLRNFIGMNHAITAKEIGFAETILMGAATFHHSEEEFCR